MFILSIYIYICICISIYNLYLYLHSLVFPAKPRGGLPAQICCIFKSDAPPQSEENNAN